MEEKKTEAGFQDCQQKSNAKSKAKNQSFWKLQERKRSSNKAKGTRKLQLDQSILELNSKDIDLIQNAPKVISQSQSSKNLTKKTNFAQVSSPSNTAILNEQQKDKRYDIRT